MKREYLLTFIEFIFIFIFVILPIRFFLFEPFLVKGESMEPTFHDWDYLIIDKLSYRFFDPQRSDIIIFRPPRNQNVYYIKRIVALPNERIVIDGSKIIIFNKNNPNGFLLEENYIRNHYNFGKVDIQLNDEEYFVLGDNREASYDSRAWGPIKRKNIVGKVLFQFSLKNFTFALRNEN